MPEPTPPTLNRNIKAEAAKDSQIALFIKDLAYAGRDCRAQLSEIGHMLDLQPEIVLADVVVTAPETEKGRAWWKLFD